MSNTSGNGRRLCLSSALAKLGEGEAISYEKQGLVSILHSDSAQNNTSSLRRALSADMSSKKWLGRGGLSSMKKIASSQEFALSSIASSQEFALSSSPSGSCSLSSDRGDHLWRSIQSNNLKEEEEPLRPQQFYIWSSILTEKHKEDSSALPPPYIHPLARSSKSSLSKRSLEICTESLGSETGSDGFCSYPPSGIGERVEEEEEEGGEEGKQVPPQLEKDLEYSSEDDDWVVVKQSNFNKKRSLSPLPPPLSSLARAHGSFFHMHSHRVSGRLVVEAMSMTSQSHFHAQRQDGRLRLTLAKNSAPNPPPQEPNDQELIFDEDQEDHVEELEEKILFQNFAEVKGRGADDDDDDDNDYDDGISGKVANGNKIKEVGIQVEQVPALSIGKINVGRMSAFTGSTVLAPSVPQPPGTAALMMSSLPAKAAATSLYNAYRWPTKPTPVNKMSSRCPLPLINSTSMSNIYISFSSHPVDQHKDDEMRPLSRGCKQPWRSIFIWETTCVATT